MTNEGKRAGHTPGPWVADEFAMQDDMPVRIGTTNGTPTYYHHSATIAECFTNHNEDRARDEPLIGPITAEANARLIAAAPDLVKALDLLIRDVADYPAWQRPCHALDVARAALKRARGEQP